MSGLTLGNLLAADPGQFATAANAWEALAEDLDPHHVWAGSAPDDPVSNPHGTHGKYFDLIPIVGPWIDSAEDNDHGISPQEADFGANQYHVDTSGHSAYWTNGSQSLQNQANIIVGHYGDVGLDHGSPPS